MVVNPETDQVARVGFEWKLDISEEEAKRMIEAGKTPKKQKVRVFKDRKSSE